MIYALLFALLVQPSFSLEPIDGDPDVQASVPAEDVLSPVQEAMILDQGSPDFWAGYKLGRRAERIEIHFRTTDHMVSNRTGSGQVGEDPLALVTPEQAAAQRFQGMLFLIVSIGISGGALLFLVSSWWRKGPTPTNPG